MGLAARWGRKGYYLLEVVEIQLEEMTELGTLDEYLSECGYVHEGGAIVPHIEMVGFEKQSVQVA